MSAKWKSPAERNGRTRSLIRRDLARPGEDADAAIVPANLRAVETLYFTAMLEEARLFQVVDRLVAMFSQGLLPVGSGRAGDILYRYWKSSQNQLTAAQRQTVYTRAFGFPGGDAGVTPNREFNDLWLRFLGTVGMYAAELQALPPADRSVSQEDLRQSGRDLAANLSAHGYGIAWFAAQELKQEIQEIMRLLSDPEITNAFGRDLWQVIERVAASEPGGRPNIPRSRTRAESGRIIIRWLANHPNLLLRPAPARILSDDHIRNRRTAASRDKDRSHPTDYDLVNACEQWLAVTGTQEAQLEEYAQPGEPPGSARVTNLRPHDKVPEA